MTLLLVGLGVLLLMHPGAVATRLARPRPRPCARLYAASMVLGLAGVLTGLVLHALPSWSRSLIPRRRQGPQR